MSLDLGLKIFSPEVNQTTICPSIAEIAGEIHSRRIARCADESGAGQFGLAPIAEREIRTAHRDLTHRSRRNLAAVVAENQYIAPRERIAHRHALAVDLRFLIDEVIRDRLGLADAVTANQSTAVGKIFSIKFYIRFEYRLAADVDQANRGKTFRAGALRRLPKQGCHTSEYGDLFLAQPIAQRCQAAGVEIENDQRRPVQQRQKHVARRAHVVRAHQADTVSRGNFQRGGFGFDTEKLAPVVPYYALGFARGAGGKVDVRDRIRGNRGTEIARRELAIDSFDVHKPAGRADDFPRRALIRIIRQHRAVVEAGKNLL